MSTIDYTIPGGRTALFYDGPLIPVRITAPPELVQYLADNDLGSYAVVEGLGLIDTGAMVSAVDRSVFHELGIPRVDTELIQTAHGVAEMDRFNAGVRLLDDPLSLLPLHRVIGGYLRTPTDRGADMIMLIGRDLLQRMSFTYDGPRGRFSITV